MIKTVPQLDQCQVVFNNTGDIIFGLNLEQEADMDDEPKYETAFKTFEASDYSSIGRFPFRNLARSDRSDR